ncbi:DNA polymerase I [Desulfococcaceae bacterium HSG9]|nr:DNA polymerase I [Desulfococcaceae bacterium HSG9]
MTNPAATQLPLQTTKTVYLIDGTAYIYRAYHAIRGLADSEGFPTNAIFGYTKMLLKLLETKAPEYIAMFFDAKGPTFRHEMYADYKANRPPMPDDLVVQLPYIKKITDAFNIAVFEKSGFEADDLIGSCVRLAENSGFDVVMVTGDKDFNQLVTAKAMIWDPMKDKTVTLDSIRKTFGVEPDKIIEIMGLSGDSSDNIPGVPGIGPKTAQTLIKTFGSMQALYEQVDTITKKKQHENLVKFKEQALLSRSLVTIDTQAPVSFDPDAMKFQVPDQDALYTLFKKLEFRQLLKAYPKKSDLSRKKYHTILSEAELDNLIARLETASLFAVDTETTSSSPMRASLVGLSFALEPDTAFYIPCAHEYGGAPPQLDRRAVLDALRPVLENPDIKKVGQNIKYDLMVLARHGVKLDGIAFDTMLASYLINPSKRAHNLDRIALDFLDHKTITYADVVGKGKQALKSFAQVAIDKAAPYACEDADITLAAYRILAAQLEKIKLTELMSLVEMPLVDVLAKMEMAGICVDREKLHELSGLFESQLETLKDEIYALAGESFNIQSSQQLGHILFEKLNLPVQKKTKKKTGYSTDVSVLTNLAALHKLPAHILRYRTLAKLKSTYTDALLNLIHPDTGRIHTSFNQTVTATGRLSSSDPNLQNIPIRTPEGMEIRKAFIPRSGWTILAADYSQIELRILAHCADDGIMIQAFQQDEDIHTRTAAEVFQVFPEMITTELRRQAKAINFGIVYGMSPFGLSKQLNISRKMAKTYIDNYFDRYKGVKQFMEQAVAQAREIQSTGTLLGRIRLLPDIGSGKKTVRDAAERIAINTPIQGTAADLIKLAMIKTDAVLTQKKMQTAMLLSVHDEIVFEAPDEELEEVTKTVANTMENIWDLKVPLKVNIASGKNWAEAH